ncbi:MAG TPA: tRNA pseudouridine(55) synthase TruB [Firmicutes bacterium]|nr:tRNA pseudouridine(55) synthase TruB [Bacillota bacterium]
MNGFLGMLKPIGLSSHDAVREVRRVLQPGSKVGHTGTLDPCATGVLVLCLGTATRLSEYMADERKSYVAEFTFGASTDTDDCLGQLVESRGSEDLTAQAVEELLPSFCGDILQVPPAFSAVSRGGIRSYKLARNGLAPQLEARVVHVERFRMLRFVPGRFAMGLFEIECSKGTYVRSLCRDLGKALGCGSFVSFLVRTGVGAFTIEDCPAMEDVLDMARRGELEKALVPPSAALSMPTITIGDEDLRRVSAGRVPRIKSGLPDGIMLLLAHPSRGVVAVGRSTGGRIMLEKVLCS